MFSKKNHFKIEKIVPLSKLCVSSYQLFCCLRLCYQRVLFRTHFSRQKVIFYSKLYLIFKKFVVISRNFNFSIWLQIFCEAYLHVLLRFKSTRRFFCLNLSFSFLFIFQKHISYITHNIFCNAARLFVDRHFSRKNIQV